MFINIHAEPMVMFRKFKTVPDLVSEQYVFDDLQECADALAGMKEGDALSAS